MGVFHRPMEKLETRVNLYYIDVSNYIVANAADTFHADSNYGFNMDEIIYYGVEMEFNSVWSDKLTFFGNYTYRKTDYDEEDLYHSKADGTELGATPILLQIAPEHKANLGLRYHLWAKTLGTTDIRYVGKRESEGNVYTLDDFITVDLGVEYQFRENLTAHFFVGNVLGEEYQEIYGYPMPERVYGVSVKAAF